MFVPVLQLRRNVSSYPSAQSSELRMALSSIFVLWWKKIWTVACETVASGYERLSKCPIKAFQCNCTLQ